MHRVTALKIRFIIELRQTKLKSEIRSTKFETNLKFKCSNAPNIMCS